MADEFNPQGVDQTPRNNENPNSTADTGNAEPKNPFVGGDSVDAGNASDSSEQQAPVSSAALAADQQVGDDVDRSGEVEQRVDPVAHQHTGGFGQRVAIFVRIHPELVQIGAGKAGDLQAHQGDVMNKQKVSRNKAACLH